MKKKFFIGLFIVTTILLFLFAYTVLTPKKQEYVPQQNLRAPIEVTSENIISDFVNYNDTEKPAIVMFYVDWCTYCRRYMPTFIELAAKHKDKYNFIVVNCDKPENINFVQEFHIMGFPSLFVVDKKINHKFSLNMASTTDNDIFEEEINNYLKVRELFSNNK